MRRWIVKILKRCWESLRKGDKILFMLCFIATAFGCLMIASATTATSGGPFQYLRLQVPAAVLGMFCYGLISSVDLDALAERRIYLMLGNTLLLLMLYPFGQTISGNRSWLDFPFLPFNIQPAELCKITYIVIMASVMASHQHNISSPRSIGHMVWHFIAIAGLNQFISGDAGVSLIFFSIFLGMAWSGGVGFIWFAAGIAGVTLIAPILWASLGDYQKMRIAVLFDPSLDPNGTGALYHTVRALRSLTGGGLTGQGLFQGNRTQTPGALYAQHTDYIFSAIGEELGFVGCALVLVLLFLIVARCIWVGIRSQDTLRRLICFGAASALIFQITSNVGMCVGLTPVIGLTLPFISYGGSSIISLYAMLGLVSGVYARPKPTSQERYIHPPLRY